MSGLRHEDGMPTSPGATSDAYACPSCGFELWLPLADLGETLLGLYDDARFPGRCILALRRHEEHLDDLGVHDLSNLMQQASRVGALLRKQLGAERINYAVLGNAEPHVHVHIIPRYFSTDPVPRRPPWNHPSPPASLDPEQRTRLMSIISTGLEGPDSPSP